MVDGNVATQRHQLKRYTGIFNICEDSFATLVLFNLSGFGQNAFQRPKVIDKLRGRFQTNARNAGNVVGGVSGQSLHIDNLFRINAEFFFNVFRRKELVFHRIIEFDAGTNKLHQILVAGNNNNLKPLSQRHIGISGNQVVRLISLHFQVIKVQRFYRFADDGELRNQIFGNFFTRAFVVGKNIVTEILPFGVKENQTIFTGDF